MPLKKSLIERSFSAKEAAFLAEQELISILPRYSMNGVQLIGRSLKKLKALQKVDVQLWLAVLLKKQNKCNIVIPEWLSLPYLKNKYQEEQRVKDRVCYLPWHWIPISKILLDVCPDDFIDSPHELRSLIQDLREIRMLKTRQGFSMIDDEYLELTGLSLMEINEVRPFLLQTMDTLRDLRKVTLSDDEDEDDIQQDRFGNKNDNNQNKYNSSNDYNDREFNHASSDANFSDPIGDSHIINTSAINTSAINTSTNDTTLVEAGAPTTKRRRVDDRSSRKNTVNNRNDDSDSDSDVEYKH